MAVHRQIVADATALTGGKRQEFIILRNTLRAGSILPVADRVRQGDPSPGLGKSHEAFQAITPGRANRPAGIMEPHVLGQKESGLPLQDRADVLETLRSDPIPGAPPNHQPKSPAGCRLPHQRGGREPQCGLPRLGGAPNAKFGVGDPVRPGAGPGPPDQAHGRHRDSSSTPVSPSPIAPTATVPTTTPAARSPWPSTTPSTATRRPCGSSTPT